MPESQGSSPPARRRREPLRAARVVPETPSTELVPDRRARRGGLFSGVGRAVGIAAAVSREVAENTREVSQDVLGAAVARRPARDIAGTVVNGWINGAVRAATVIQDETGIEVASDSTDLGMGSAHEMREELRRRGEDLLRRSTQLDDPDEHPAFRGIISELAPDEARIISFLATAGPQPVVSLLEVDRMKKSTREIARHVSFIGLESGCLRPRMTPVYIDNLARLGVVFIRDFTSGPREQYDVLYAQPEIDDVPGPTGRFVKRQPVDRSVELSAFGRSLYDMCFADSDVNAGLTDSS